MLGTNENCQIGLLLTCSLCLALYVNYRRAKSFVL